MNFKNYVENISFRRLKRAYNTSECPVCYLPIETTQNIVFGCSHNACSKCVMVYLEKAFTNEKLPSCFLCRTPMCLFDTRNRGFKCRVHALLEKNRSIKRDEEVLDNLFTNTNDQPLTENADEMYQIQNERRLVFIRTFNARRRPYSIIMISMGSVAFFYFFMTFLWKSLWE